jgi:tagatose 1,6-diphosphate aldolase
MLDTSKHSWTPGKIRGLDCMASDSGVITCLAIDHSENYIELLDRDWKSVQQQRVTSSKLSLIGALADSASAVLLDPIWSAAQAVTDGAIPAHTGLVLAVDELVYRPGAGFVYHNAIRSGWSVEKAKRMGADAIKMALWWRHDAPDAESTVDLARSLVAEAQRYDVPLMVEPLWYPFDGEDLSEVRVQEARTASVIEAAAVFCDLGIDVLKTEYPTTDPAMPAANTALEEIAGAADGIPWVLLSGGGNFDTFRSEVELACEAGAAGFVAGRAVWGDAVGGSTQTQEVRIDGANARLREIAALVEAKARPWRDAAGIDAVMPAFGSNWRFVY